MRAFAAFLLSLAAVAAFAADDKMLYVEYRLAGADIKEGSFDAQVKKLWRVGDTFLRFEDAPNTVMKVHGLIIVAEPDIWIIDRFTNQAQHTVDPGPGFKIHFPLLASETSEKLRQLEFGRELEYFQENNAKELPVQEMDGVRCKPRQLDVDDRRVTLCTKTDDTPARIVVKGPEYEYIVRFERYERDRRVDRSLFQLPPDVPLKK